MLRIQENKEYRDTCQIIKRNEYCSYLHYHHNKSK